MPRIFIPPLLKTLTDGSEVIETSGKTVGEVINELESRFPGIKAKLCEGDELQPGLSISVNDKISTRGLLQKLDDDSEVHFLPSIGGG